MIVAGFDEAGYGPKLGPLVVGWTAFEVADATFEEPVDLWERLKGAVRRTGKEPDSKVWVADSKAIKPRKNGLKNLELGVLAFRDEVGVVSLPELLTELGEASALNGQPWFRALEQVRLPSFAWAGEVASRGQRIQEAFDKGAVRYHGAAVRVLDATRYNARIAATQNKGHVLGETFVSLVKQLRTSAAGPLDITCDKHGGRSNYVRLLGQAFPLCRIRTVEETAYRSTYWVETARGLVRVCFRQEAEDESLPTALASMHCKYLREVLMGQLNAWFQEQLPGLKATAGYALDAKRFLAEVEESLPELGVRLDTLLRAR